MTRFILGFAILLFLPVTLLSQEFLEAHVWLNADLLRAPLWEPNPLPDQPDYEEPIDEDIFSEILTILLEESRYLYSGSIYGWEFRYRPAYRQLGVEEYYEINLLGEVPWGSPNLEVRTSYREGVFFHMDSRLFLDETQSLRRRTLLSNQLAQSGGRGTGSALHLDYPRREALLQALKQSIRNYLQPRERVRPREISGRIYLRQMPHFSHAPDSYSCQVMVMLEVDEVVHYP